MDITQLLTRVQEHQISFLKAMAHGASALETGRISGANLRTMYKLKKHYPGFAQLWQEAEQQREQLWVRWDQERAMLTPEQEYRRAYYMAHREQIQAQKTEKKRLWHERRGIRQRGRREELRQETDG